MIERVLQDRLLQGLIARVASGETPLAADGVWGSSAPLIAAAIQIQTNRPILYVTAHLDEADSALDDLELFTGRTPELFPAWEGLPSEDRGVDEIQAQRVGVCRHLSGHNPETESSTSRFVVSPIQALLQPVPDREHLERLSLEISHGQSIGPETLVDWLVEHGFERLDQVEAPSDFAVRGGIVDVFCPNDTMPVRIELFGDEVESIRRFDPSTQRSTEPVEQVVIAGAPPASQNQTKETTHLFSHLGDESIIVWDDLREVREMAGIYFERIGDQTGMYPPAAIERAASRFLQIELSRFGALLSASPLSMKIESLQRFEDRAEDAVVELCGLANSQDVVLFCDNEAEQRRLDELIVQHVGKVPQGMELAVGLLHQGFRWPSLDLIVAGHHEVFHRYQRRRKIRKIASGRPIDSFLDLESGDFVVHVSHGIARFRGMKTLKKEDRREEFLTLEFADDVVLHVPAHSIDLIQKYIGSGGRRPTLSKLGGKGWGRAKEKVGEAVNDLAGDLLKLQVERQTKEGMAYPPDTEWQDEFEGSFIYQETEDQLSVMEELKRDQGRTRPMDRLLCGDVGYGKTELAMRAAFKVIEYGRQVAVLVPTTILAEQHFNTFRERMADYPFVVECLSRFRSPKQQKQIVERAKKGQIDVLIGTHRLISKDVGFANLGLLVIDEEQRFGVQHKERLKQMRAEVDVLTMTATPIPRTLHMSLLGLRDISALSTPPLDRRSIITEIRRFDAALIRDAVLREMNRDGQVYFLHNRVQSIASTADTIREIVPEARVLYGHGQMNEHELEDVMLRFIRGEADVLVCTTIIESGVDIPNVNTIFINDADRFGLADLHQLRGRVGRYKHRAYAYLLLNPRRKLTREAARRLKAIEEYSELGAGFRIAMRDLELRGAGNILGPEQSGHIATVGYEMYCQLLEEAVSRQRGDQAPAPRGAHVDLEISASIPRSYIASDKLRLETYARLSKCRTPEELNQLEQDLTDSFGRPPEDVELLLQLAEIRLRAALWRIRAIIRHDPDIIFTVEDLTLVDRLFEGAAGTVRLPDHQTVHWRLPSAYLEPSTLLTACRRLLQTPAPETRVAALS